jgi:hypothetical protein
MRIVVYGLAKTGTSVLFYKIRNSLPGAIALFEPVSRGPLVRLRVAAKTALTGRRHPHTLAKVLLFGPRQVRLGDFAGFDKQILIVRDPRDRLVSALLYSIFDSRFVTCEKQVREFVALLRRKEADPASIPLMAVIERFWALDGRVTTREDWARNDAGKVVEGAIAFHRRHPHLHVVYYEDMVEGRLDALASYLGFPLQGAGEVDASVNRVARTRTHGGWRDWWTPEDVAVIGPVLQPYLDRYYPAADWRLATPRLEPEHGSGYVARLANERRGRDKLPLIAWDDRSATPRTERVFGW